MYDIRIPYVCKFCVMRLNPIYTCVRASPLRLDNGVYSVFLYRLSTSHLKRSLHLGSCIIICCFLPCASRIQVKGGDIRTGGAANSFSFCIDAGRGHWTTGRQFFFWGVWMHRTPILASPGDAQHGKQGTQIPWASQPRLRRVIRLLAINADWTYGHRLVV
jgi:hypothetical protein